MIFVQGMAVAAKIIPEKSTKTAVDKPMSETPTFHRRNK